MKISSIRLSINAAVIACAFATLAGPCAPTLAGAGSQDSGPKAEWNRIALPFRPVSIASDGSVLWVCGADEMLAESNDGGTTWQVKHQKAGADVLLSVGILGDRIVYAAGTNGDTLLSGDNGETWSAWKAGTERIVGMVFADSLHGIRQALSGAQTTSDGGKTWSAISAMSADSAVSPFSNVLGMAALDSTHSALLLNKPEGENILRPKMAGQLGHRCTSTIPTQAIYSRAMASIGRWA